MNGNKFDGVLQSGKDFDMSKICSCNKTMNQCERDCGKYYSCENIAMANDILVEYEETQSELHMNKRLEYLIDEVEKLNYSITQECDSVYDIGKFSPCGQDCHVSIDTENNSDLFIENIRAYVSEYDVSYETYLWLDDEGHGSNGAPYDMKDVYEDMEWWKDSLENLANTLESLLSEYDLLESE